MLGSIREIVDFRQAWSVSDDKTVRLWDPGLEPTLQTLEGYSSRVNAVAFSPDGKLVASSDDETVRLWDAGSGAALQTLEIKVVVKTLLFSDDGTSLKTDKGLLLTTSLPPSAVPSQRRFSRDIFMQKQ
jgi:WD40 repeat protein